MSPEVARIVREKVASQLAAALTTENPLLDVWRTLWPDEPLHWLDRRWTIDDERLRDAYTLVGRTPSGYLSHHDVRDAATMVWSFAIPTADALDVIASAAPVVEVGAGTGYWARLLRDRGVDVVAYDDFGESYHKWFPGMDPWTEVERADAAIAAARHPDRTLLMVWPPMTDMAARAFTAYAKAGGKRMVYVGEERSGCTASSDFWHALATSGWHETARVDLPQWPGIHDYLTAYEATTGKALGLDPKRLP